MMSLELIPFYLDNTGRSLYNTCPRKAYWQMIRGFRLKRGSTALRYGTVWHAILEAHYKGLSFDEIIMAAGQSWLKETDDFEFQDDYRSLETAVDAYSLYRNHFEYDKDIEILATERNFQCPITQLGIYQIILTGKIDLEVKMDGLKWIFDNKTTSQPIFMQSERLGRDPQFVGYSFSGRIEDPDIVGCIINMHQLTSRKKKDGTYGETKIDFARIPNIYSEQDYRDWQDSFVDTCWRMIQSMENNSWPQHRENCWNYNSPCSYLSLCNSGYPLTCDLPDGFMIKVWNFKEPGK